MVAATVRAGHEIHTFACLQSEPNDFALCDQIKLRGMLARALISSFEIVQKWETYIDKNDKIPVEAYLFMQRSADRALMKAHEQICLAARQTCERIRHNIKPHSRPRSLWRHSALELMARPCDNQPLIDKTATSILSNGQKTIAIATYLPSLSAGERGLNPEKGKPSPEGT